MSASLKMWKEMQHSAELEFVYLDNVFKIGGDGASMSRRGRVEGQGSTLPRLRHRPELLFAETNCMTAALRIQH